MPVTVHILNAFSDDGLGGNPAGVVLDADRLSPIQKLSVAAQVELSETAFVSASASASVKVDFFTPTRQIPHCGHATVATFALCRKLGRLRNGQHTKESTDGILQVQIADELITLRQSFPSFAEIDVESPLGQRCLHAISARKEVLQNDSSLTVARAGNAFLLIPVASEESLSMLSPREAEIASISQELELIGFYPFAPPSTRQHRAATTRMFAPLYGISEESATGTAAGPLGALILLSSSMRSTCEIEQGHFMQPPSPSLLSVGIDCAIASGAAPSVLVSGTARYVEAIQVEV